MIHSCVVENVNDYYLFFNRCGKYNDCYFSDSITKHPDDEQIDFMPGRYSMYNGCAEYESVKEMFHCLKIKETI